MLGSWRFRMTELNLEELGVVALGVLRPLQPATSRWQNVPSTSAKASLLQPDSAQEENGHSAAVLIPPHIGFTAL